MTWTCTGPWIPNLSLMWPAMPKELPTPVLVGAKGAPLTLNIVNF